MNRKILFVTEEGSAPPNCGLPQEFEVAYASSGDEALVCLGTRGPFAIVVSDMHLPGMNGVEFLKRARQVAPRTQRLLLAPDLEFKDVLKAVNEGRIFHLLVKPLREADLTKAITSALNSFRQREEERMRIELPVRVFRVRQGRKPPQLVHTVDISQSGARIAGLEEPLDPGELVRIECGDREAPFRVIWMGANGSSTAGQAGVECLAAADLWKLDLRHMEDSKPLLRARAVQAGLLPQEKPPLKTLDYAGACIQARMVGGDYFDFLDMAPGEVGFVLADVAGKGLPAALLMASLQGSLHRQSGSWPEDLCASLASANQHFYKHSTRDRYAALFFGRYRDDTRTLQYVNCGHNPPLLLRQAGGVERLAATATVLGLFPEWQGSEAETRLQPGDILSLYTDGITETTGGNGEEFGEERLLETLRANRELEAAYILRNVQNTIEQFRLGEQEDDLTLVIARAR